MVLASHTIDLTSPGAETDIDGGIFKQADFTDTSLGTGVVNSFLRIKANGVINGFNTDAQPPFEALGGNFTKSLLLSDIPTVEIDGVLYREIWLDINEPGTYPEAYISLDTYEIWTSNQAALTESQYTLGTGFTGGVADLQYDIGDNSMILDYNLAQGSGNNGDLVQYIPDSSFDDVADCGYGDSTCTTYFYLFATFGENNHADETDPDFGDVTADNGGFEEFFVIDRPVVQVVKTAVVDSELTYDWSIEKSVVPESHSGFIGDEFSSDYTVTVTRDDGTVTEQSVSGTITITNDGNLDATITSVTDVLADYGVIDVDCGVTFPYDLATGGDSLTCSYSEDATGATIGDTNTARVELTEVLGASPAYTDTVDVVFNDASEVNATVDVSDIFDNGDAVVLGTDVGETTTFPVYSQNFECNETNSSTTGTTTNYENTASTDLDDEASADVDVTCYVPTVSKTANGSYDEDHEWTITKSVDPESQSAFAGEQVTYEWTIEVTEAVTYSNFAVDGTITVVNTSATDVLVVDLSDVMSDTTEPTISADADCALVDGELTVPAGGTATCDYSADLDLDDPANMPATNTVTISINGNDYSDIEDISWTADVTNDAVNLIDPDLGIDETLTDGTTRVIDVTYTCSTESTTYDVNGYYQFQDDNTASLIYSDTTQDDSMATTTVDCYQPSISKTAAGTYDLVHDWEVIKTVQPESQNAFAGDQADFTWTIEVNQLASVEQNHDITGIVTVVNPNPDDHLLVTVTDELSNGQIVPLVMSATCIFDGNHLVVMAGGSAECSYAIDDVGAQVSTNTASFTLNDIAYSVTQPVGWAETEINEDPVINDVDFVNAVDLVDVAVDDLYETDVVDFDTCPAPGSDLYNEDGVYTVTHLNTVYLTTTDGGMDNDDATTTVNCFAPSTTADQSATYDVNHDWSVTKSVEPVSQSGGPGDVLSWTWTVVVDETETMVGFETTGSFTVTNSHPTESITFTTAELLAGHSEIVYVEEDDIICPALTVGPQSSVTCTFTEALTEAEAATFADATVDMHIGPESVIVADTEIGLNMSVDGDYTTVGDVTVVPDDAHTCSSSWADYAPDGSYSAQVDNTATISDDIGVIGSSMASTTYQCDAGRIEVLKSTNGVVDPTRDWAFTLFEGPGGFDGGTVIGSATTLGDADGVLTFGDAALTIGETYTLCEVGLLVAWEGTWSVDGTPVLPYNPDADPTDPENLGNYCVDVTIDAAGVVTYDVDNRVGDGGQRTPGYWKNWSTCSGGNQVQTAANNGGYLEGYWLIDDVLLLTGGIQLGDLFLDAGSCQEAVTILNHRSIDDEQVHASDPAYRLARNLLAAKANVVAGASSCTEITEAILAAEALLADIGFDGTGDYFKGRNKKNGSTANDLSALLDAYNNGEIC